MTELLKFSAYRAPLAAAAAGVLLTGFWDATLLFRGSAAGDARRILDSSLAMGGVILPLTWFALPILLVTGDTHDGTLRPALVANPHPRRVLAAKWATATATGLLVGLLSWTLLGVTLAGVPDSGAVLPLYIAAAPRLAWQSVLCVALAMVLHVLSGYRGGPWILLGLLLWIHLIERVLGSALPGQAGMLGSPFRLVDFWIRQRWQDTDFALLDQIGFLPLTGYTLGLALLAVALFQVYADPSGRPWGRKHG